MMKTDVTALNHTVHQTREWLDDLVARGPFDTEQQAYSHLRAVLHSVRDRLTPEEAVHFAAQLPMLVRGFYYEGWRPALAPNDETEPRQFFDSIRESLRGTDLADDALDRSTRAVFGLLSERVDAGQIRHVRGQLPEPLRELWPDDRPR